MKRLCPFEGYFIISMPGHTVPVRRAGAIVAIRTRQAAGSTVIQVATAPRGVHARRTGRIERSHTPLHCSKKQSACGDGKPSPQAGEIVYGGFRGLHPLYVPTAHIHPLFLPDPASRGTPLQYAVPGPRSPSAQGRPQVAPSSRRPPRQGAYTPAEPGEKNAART